WPGGRGTSAASAARARSIATRRKSAPTRMAASRSSRAGSSASTRSSFFCGPFVSMFKPGYGDYEWPGYKESENWPKEKREALRTEAQLLQLDGIVLEMPTLSTAEQRKEYLKRLEVAVVTVPLEKRALLQKAFEDERRALGYGSRRQP